MINELQEGARLQILHEPEQEYYMTSIKNISRESFTIHEPASGGKTLNMPWYSTWQFCLLRNDAVYFYISKVVGVSKDGVETVYTLEIPESVHRQQRRGHVRVPCHNELLYWLRDEIIAPGMTAPHLVVSSPELRENQQWLENYIASLEAKAPGRNAFTLDVSGGGLRMVTLDPLDRHEGLLIKVVFEELHEKKTLLLEGRVVRVVPLNIGGWKRYRVGVSFVNLDEKIQEYIISYLFTIMRKKV